eukprot:TRINITY_DN9398_c0_g1_i3.p1 TRINITY_DN9398_c0_g1~~TRINITY_DN9398_c0_g1_i3.p1  ORF type:complete len:316 (+),score=81.04 TRINITY_DN9398_c0_g1_i3:359-1306(+)
MEREAALLTLATSVFRDKVIIFFKTKLQCHRMAIVFGLLGLKSCELHGNLSQNQRIQALDDFKDGKYSFLLATDLAARGIDVKDVKTVINFELPTELTRYIHRVGRTARAGESGVSLTICDDNERKKLKSMLKKYSEKLFVRTLDVETMNKYGQRVQELETEIRKIHDEEKVEREIRKAEMEATKAQNLLKYEDEIVSRPKREWIVSNSEKRKIREQSKEMIMERTIAKREEKKRHKPNREVFLTNAQSKMRKQEIEKAIAKKRGRNTSSKSGKQEKGRDQSKGKGRGKSKSRERSKSKGKSKGRLASGGRKKQY